jgi:hypothetical protein
MGIAFDIEICVCSYNRSDIFIASAQVFTEILHTGIDAEIGVICFSGFDSICSHLVKLPGIEPFGSGFSVFLQRGYGQKSAMQRAVDLQQKFTCLHPFHRLPLPD